MLESRNGQRWPQLTECTLTPSDEGRASDQAQQNLESQRLLGKDSGMPPALPPHTGAHWVTGNAAALWRSPAQKGKRWKHPAQSNPGAVQSLHRSCTPSSPALCLGAAQRDPSPLFCSLPTVQMDFVRAEGGKLFGSVSFPCPC